MPLPRTATTTTQDLLNLRVDGWCLLEGVIPEAELDHVRESVLRTVESPAYLEDIATARDAGYDGRTHFPAHDADFVRYVAHPRILSVVEALWGRWPRVAWTGPVIREPGVGRGGWHIDWPCTNLAAAGIPAPFPDAVMTLTSLWMLSEFTPDTGGTIIAPGSHRSLVDPATDPRVDRSGPLPTEMRVSGDAGSVFLFDSRLWHANPDHRGTEPRVAMRVQYAPWWLNLQPMDPASPEGRRMLDIAQREHPTRKFGSMAAPPVPRIPSKAYDAMPEAAKPLYHHWVR